MAKIAINIVSGNLQKEETIVGIDLGTTNSLISIISPESGKPIALKEFDGSVLVPSIVYFNENGSSTVGEPAKAFLESAPLNTVYSAKSLIGREFDDIDTSRFPFKVLKASNGMAAVNINGNEYSPIELSSIILKNLKERAEHILKNAVNRCVITVPAYFNDQQRQATRDAGKLAGLDVLRIINEPTAASLAYGFGTSTKEEKIIAVYDLGGGTFDMSILKLHSGVFEVLSTHGNTSLGGDDFDKAITEFWNKQHPESHHPFEHLRILAERAKVYLSENENFSEKFEGISYTLNKSTFNSLIVDFITTTIDSCKKALKDAGLKVKQINEVVMVGGSTRVPLVKEMVKAFFERDLNDTLNPDEVVALGAAVQADILAGNTKDLLLLDVTPLSLGIETAGRLMDVIIPRNSKIPTGAAREYTTQQDGQSGIRISVYQGERDIVDDNRLLDTFNLSGIPAMPAGFPKVKVSFSINADGILSVKAKELRSGVEQAIQVKPKEGISDADVERMLEDSIMNANADIAARALAEAKTEGEQLLATTEKFIQKNAAYLTQSELLETANAMQAVQLAITMNDKNLITEKNAALNEISRPYAERIMDLAVEKALKGKQV